MCESQFQTNPLLGLRAAAPAPVKQESGQFFQRRMREAERAYLHVSRMIVLTEMLGHTEAGFRMLAQEAQEIIFLNEVDLSAFERFRSGFIKQV